MIERKKKICIQCNKEVFLFSKGRCQPCSKIVSMALKKGKQVEKKESVSLLVKELDTVFSEFIRLREADSEGNVICYTSGKKMHWRKSQCGHFISRRKYGTRWNEINCQVQSVKENVFNQGNAPEFGRRLAIDYGQEVVDNLFLLSGQTVKLDRLTLRFQIQHYTKLVEGLKQSLGITD